MINKAKKYFLNKVIRFGIKHKSKLIIKLTLLLSKVRIDFEQKILRESSIFNQIHIARFSRIHYYSSGILNRINHLLKEYLIDDNLHISKNDIIVDIGVNIGEFSLGINSLYETCNIIAIEPDPTEFTILKMNLKNLKNFKSHNLALSNKNSKKTFYLNNDSGDSSLDNKSENKIIVETKILDDLLKGNENIGLIKLEAEGHEPEVLYGAIETLKKTKYLTIDVGPERNNKSTLDLCNEILNQTDFILLKRGTIRETVLYYNKKLVSH